MSYTVDNPMWRFHKPPWLYILPIIALYNLSTYPTVHLLYRRSIYIILLTSAPKGQSAVLDTTMNNERLPVGSCLKRTAARRDIMCEYSIAMILALLCEYTIMRILGLGKVRESYAALALRVSAT